jgi:hypothetical protein
MDHPGRRHRGRNLHRAHDRGRHDRERIGRRAGNLGSGSMPSDRPDRVAGAARVLAGRLRVAVLGAGRAWEVVSAREDRPGVEVPAWEL